MWKDFDGLSPEDWQNCLAGTLFATLHASRAALPALRASSRGRIINILDADADATDPVPFATAYKIGKRATFSLTTTMAVTEARHGITVNAISPGTLEDSPRKPALDRIPAGRYGTYEDIAQAVLFVASEGADYLTGAHLKVSGGYLVWGAAAPGTRLRIGDVEWSGGGTRTPDTEPPKLRLYQLSYAPKRACSIRLQASPARGQRKPIRQPGCGRTDTRRHPPRHPAEEPLVLLHRERPLCEPPEQVPKCVLVDLVTHFVLTPGRSNAEGLELRA